MVTTASSYTDSRYRSHLGEGLDGVVRVNYAGYYATGALLFDGRAVLTAAHLFDMRTGSASVTFETIDGAQTLSAVKILLHPEYDTDTNNDLAIVWLDRPAPTGADRYNIYRNADELGKVFTLVGYGAAGTGSSGAIDTTTAPIRLKASNQFDVDAGTLKSYLGALMAWTPMMGTQLVADFDSGSTVNDALGQLIYRNSLGQGLNEGLIAQGDSGGPAFLDGRIAGVASYTSSLSRGGIKPDVDAFANSSFGEIAAWQRVSAYQQWIDEGLRANYSDAPSRRENVKQVVSEGDSGTRYAFFLLEFTGARSDLNQIVSVDYATRDGTALSGSDYIAVSSTLNLYPNENQAIIPVEIIGDFRPEPYEHFYLDVFNPIGGRFGEGIVKLTAVRTIADDDGWFE